MTFRSKTNGWLYLLPQMLIIFIFFIWPSVSAVIQSFYFSDAFGLHHGFSGLQNYLDLFRDPGFFKSVWVTVCLALAINALALSLGILLAFLVDERSKSRRWYKSILLCPYAVAPAVAAILWRFLWQPSLGWFSYAFHEIGIDVNYLTHPTQALWIIILAASWQQLSYNFLFYFVAIQAIPSGIKEASLLDTPSFWHRFWRIIFPLVSPTTFFLLIMNIIYAFFDTFGIIDVITAGGPSNDTTSLIYKVYHDGFVNMDPGASAAQSVMLMAMVIGLTLFQFRFLEKRVHYK